MVQNLIAAFSLLIGLAGLTLTYAAHRQKGRQDSQTELKLRERRRIARRQRERHQASMISTNVVGLRHTLDSNWIIWTVEIENRSNQPVRDVCVCFRGDVIGESPLLGTGECAFPLPPSESDAAGYQMHITADFTDVSGIRWRREGYGALRRAHQGADGWEDPEPPDIQWVAPPPAGGVPGSGPMARRAPRRRRRGWVLRPVAVLVSVVLIAGGVWWLLHH
ncbi:hypothetical protein ACIRU3_31410 [Streptomyces sp. NPDC101151]|uniref:hypothetical protein n=1 Tax=Streptomyces sp. NPDC101151 TaxID=3366115 RepID=UPI003809D712